jgi:hypothetical protein
MRARLAVSFGQVDSVVEITSPEDMITLRTNIEVPVANPRILLHRLRHIVALLPVLGALMCGEMRAHEAE